jgi:hypothetical protein
MLDFRFKSLRLVSFVIGIGTWCFHCGRIDKQLLFHMLLKCYHIPHLLAKFGLVVDMQIDEESTLDIFEMSIGTSEPTKEVVNKEL